MEKDEVAAGMVGVPWFTGVGGELVIEGLAGEEIETELTVVEGGAREEVDVVLLDGVGADTNVVDIGDSGR